MTTPVEPSPAPAEPPTGGRPPAERGWWRLLLALAAFLLVPALPQFRAVLPVEHTMVLVVPALAACCLVGWWAGGRLLLAAIWVGLAVLVAVQTPAAPSVYHNLARGWSLLLAGAFGLVCLFGARRPFFPRALTSLTVAFGLAFAMSAFGPMTGAQVREALGAEFGRRNAETVTTMRQILTNYSGPWRRFVSRVPRAADAPAEIERQLGALSNAGVEVFPALLALESLGALAFAWAAYHRLGRTRLGSPLGPLKDFRFNDQLVWGLIVGLTIVFLPTLAGLRTAGSNLLVFFGALYALRGLGVLAWFLAPGALAGGLTVGLAMLLWPVLNVIAVLGFMILLIAALGLGLGDTWADWRRRPRPTT
ncbi:MAG: DUF2232 domain-containing protein [Gemmatimonadaceae bacterium]